ncbi:MAG: hypothetical protein WCG92_13270, partial [Hyphomicrobiales bacterium]
MEPLAKLRWRGDFSSRNGVSRGIRNPNPAWCLRDKSPPGQDLEMPLRETLSNTWNHVQGFLFPMLRQECGPLTERHERLVIVLEIAGVEAFVQTWHGLPGRPLKDRHALARVSLLKTPKRQESIEFPAP